MRKKDFLSILSAFAIAGFVLFLFVYSPGNGNKFTIADIKVAIEGKVKKKVAVREGLITHAKISRYNKSDTLILLGESVDRVNVGDIILKEKNSPFFYIKEEGAKRKKFTYVLIPKSILNDEDFPKQWKDSCKTSWKEVVVN